MHRGRGVLAAGALASVFLLSLILTLVSGAPTLSHPAPHASVPGPSIASALGAPDATVVAAPAFTGPLALATTSTPAAICAANVSTCTAGTGEARVTLTAISAQPPAPYWPDVQVAFVIETTAYDGVYNHYFGYPGTDPCALANSRMGLPCEESNGVPFFMDHADQVAAEISRANSHSHVTFALVDFFGTDCGDWNDCGDSQKYHVDIPQFIPANEFGGEVRATLKDQVFGGTYSGIVGLDDNFLHSPSITALYGAIIGSGLDWSPDTHHVVVLMGSTAPRDPSYVENYYVSPFDSCCGGTQADGWTCEPAYPFGEATSPNCEGWVRSQDGNPYDSIAGLAHHSPSCTQSVGHICTIDTIDLWTTPTDPYSRGWPVGPKGGGPGGTIVQQNVAHVLEAGCDLAAATGGSWDGPAYATCPDGRQGDLQYVPHGSVDQPNTQNPTLLSAFRKISFGPIYQTLVANGTNQPMFSYVPLGSIRIAPDPQWAASCLRADGKFLSTCQIVPTVSHEYGFNTFGWNFSTNVSQNAMYVGDAWSASFNVMATGPPFTTVPLDACVTAECHAAGSGSVDGFYTWAYYRTATNTTTVVVNSFPLATVLVEVAGPVPSLPSAPPPPPPPPPAFPIVTAPAVPVPSTVGTFSTVGVANVSLQAVGAGFIGAGFLRVSMKNKPIAMRVAAMSGKFTSKFDKGLQSTSGGVGRFE